MNRNALVAFAGTTSRRGSLLSLGGLAAALSGDFDAAVKAKSGKHGKHGRKKCKNPCQTQVSQCALHVTALCNKKSSDPDACKEQNLPCCDFLATCQAGEMLQCIEI